MAISRLLSRPVGFASVFAHRVLVARRGERIRSERGAALTEYGLLLILVVMASFAIIGLVGGEIVELFTDTHSDFSDARDAQSAS